MTDPQGNSDTSEPALALIVAMAANGVIGRDNALPWKISGDLQYFKRVTMGKPLVMGRRTWESLGRPLPGRPNLVVTRQPGYRADGAEVFDDLGAALARADTLAQEQGAEEVMLIGGAELYAQALPGVQRMYLTRIDRDVEGDTRFPEFNEADWQEVSSTAVDDPDWPHRFTVLERVLPGQG